MSPPRIDVVKVLSSVQADGGAAQSLTNDEAEAVLEIAYLSTVVDGRLSDEELDAFASLAARLRKRPIEGRDLDQLLDRYAGHVAHRDVDERLAEVAKSLTRPQARRTAYKVAFAMALADLGTSDDEDAFGDALVGVLGLSIEDADELEGEVYAALDEVQ
jgi:tellurite resistance protein